ncbi:ABC transporter ATP-binding protein [Mediterraneibacter glycyrrhizinilyticus]|nr:ABC transporter ATP-binding protein [Mediterraneibacter glycyrrhizinilyticus]MBM6801995.1 ABC transporter ATP-binding protein [Mediterraneibacter glycyrrhizinilyticus]
MIEFKNVEIKYGDFTAFENLNLTVGDGEFFTFLGPSGCGKTTALRALVGFLTPTAGEITLDGKDLIHVPVEKRGIGMVFQSYALFPTMTVYENLAFGLKVKKMPAYEIDKRVREVAKTIAIKDEQLVRNVSELSGGQQQRVALARAIVLEPKILCLDEPLSNLDAKLRVSLRSELKRLQKNLGITTLYVTHDQEEALMLSDKIAVFNNGTVEQVGTPQEIYDHSGTEFVCDFIGDINKLGVKVVAELNREGASLDVNRHAYIRLERIHFDPAPEYLKLSGEVINYDYNGITTKYHVNTCGEIIRIIKVNDGRPIYQNGEKIDMYLNPADIMQY